MRNAPTQRVRSGPDAPAAGFDQPRALYEHVLRKRRAGKVGQETEKNKDRYPFRGSRELRVQAMLFIEMPNGETRLRHFLFGAGLCGYAAVLLLYRFFETPGLGIAHLYYVAILLVAITGGPMRGASAAFVATVLYVAGVYWNPRVPISSLPTLATGIRLATFLIVGTLIGFYASRSRKLLAQSDALAEELRILARRDFISGLPNQRAFEGAINARVEAAEPFGLVLCQVSPPPSGTATIDWLLAIGESLIGALPAEAHVSRVSDHQFAVLTALSDGQSASSATLVVEQALSRFSHPLAGWATYPTDSYDALGLFTSASERLYARAIARGENPDRNSLTAV